MSCISADRLGLLAEFPLPDEVPPTPPAPAGETPAPLVAVPPRDDDTSVAFPLLGELLTTGAG